MMKCLLYVYVSACFLNQANGQLGLMNINGNYCIVRGVGDTIWVPTNPPIYGQDGKVLSTNGIGFVWATNISTATILQNTRSIYGNNFNGSADLNQVIGPSFGGTGINNGARTLTISTNSGTIAFSAANKTITFGNSITFIGTDGTTHTLPSTSASIARTDAAQTFNGQNGFPSGITEGGEGSLIAATSAIANTETKILSSDAAMVANRLVAGTSIMVTLHGTCTSTGAGVGIIRIRYGTAATVSDGIMQAFTLAAAPITGTAVPFTIRIIFTIRTTGASGTTDGGLDLINNGTTGLSATATQVVRGTATNINTTTASTFFTVSYISGNAATACTFQDAIITILNK